MTCTWKSQTQKEREGKPAEAFLSRSCPCLSPSTLVMRTDIWHHHWRKYHSWCAERLVPLPGRFCIPKGNAICSYQEKPDEVDESLTVSSRRSRWQTSLISSSNIWWPKYWPVHQPRSSSRWNCLQSDVKTGHTSFSYKAVNETFANHCNVMYKQLHLEFRSGLQETFMHIRPSPQNVLGIMAQRIG